jgi:Zn-dependent protease
MTEAILWYLVFVFSATLHEAAHAWAAFKGGDQTAYLGGQVSLDPLPHIKREPFGMVLVPIIALALVGWPFGYASAPYDPDWEWRYPKKAGWMAAAGPASNLLVTIIAGLVMILCLKSGLFTPPQDSLQLEHLILADGSPMLQKTGMLLSMLFTLNLVLFTFNLLPLPPLDGATILALFLKPAQFRSFATMMKHPMIGIFGILIAWNIFPLIFSPVFSFALSLVYLWK